MEEEKNNKLLVLVTYTIKTGCVMSPFPPVFMKEREPCCFPFFFLGFMFVHTHKKKSDFQLQSYSSTTKSG
jgi:hypothetical protein